MKKNTYAMLLSIIISLILMSALFLGQYSHDRFIIKGAFFSAFLVVYVTTLFFLRTEHVVYLLIFMSFFTLHSRQLYTTSTNVIIIISVLVLWARHMLSGTVEGLFDKIKNNSMTLPLVLLICSYTISLLFVDTDMGIHLMMYQSIICISVLMWLIVATVREERQLKTVNGIMLAVLLVNLLFSALFLMIPQIDEIRARFFSLYVFIDESATRLQGLSFRGEAYGEYLMICAFWLFVMLLSGQLRQGKLFLWLIAAATVVAMILTRSRGANLVFLTGILFFLVTSRSVQLAKKVTALAVLILIFGATLVIMKVYSQEVTLMDRLYELSDKSRMVAYVPETRYYTWVPAFNNARKHNFMGVGPSLSPYITPVEWQEIVADEGSGDVIDWPHNNTLLIVSTVGVYGLLAYLFLAYRTIMLKRLFPKLGEYSRHCYSAYLMCFVLFLLEGQKYDGFLRTPNSNFYFIFILIALLFTCHNMPEPLEGAENKNISAPDRS